MLLRIALGCREPPRSELQARVVEHELRGRPGELLLVARSSAAARVGGGEEALHVLDPLGQARVGRVEERLLRILLSAPLLQVLEDVGGLGNVVARGRHQREAVLVGFRLHLARVTGDRSEEAGAAERQWHAGERRRDGREHAGPVRCVAKFADRMPMGRMGDLVAEKRRQLRLALHPRQDPAVNIDGPVRQREGVEAEIAKHVDPRRDLRGHPRRNEPGGNLR